MPSRAEELLAIMAPKPCPFPLLRVGGDRDGAYLVPDDLDGIGACFSPGVNNFKKFEDELAEEHGIKSHMCDFSSDPESFRTPIIPGLQTFEKKWLDPDDEESGTSLDDWVNRRSPCQDEELILQMDIEGAEYRNITDVSNVILRRFRIVVIELHRLIPAFNHDHFDEELAPLLDKLSLHHVVVHAHPNNVGGEVLHAETGMNIPNFIELTWLRKDRLGSDLSHCFRPQLPHPLDIPFNGLRKPPVHLNQRWLGSTTKTHQSEIKILEDRLAYAEALLKRHEGMERRLARSHRLEKNALEAKLKLYESKETPPLESQCLDG